MSATGGFGCFLNVHLLIKYVVHSRMTKKSLYFIDWLNYVDAENKSFTIGVFIFPSTDYRIKRINSIRITFMDITGKRAINYTS